MEHYILIDHLKKGKEHDLTALAEENSGRITIGRITHGCVIEIGWEDLDLTNDISRYHATIEQILNFFYLTDKSTHGTFVNGKRVTEAGHVLVNGDMLSFGPYGPLEFRLRDYTTPQSPA